MNLIYCHYLKRVGGENIYTKLLFLHNIYTEGDIENSNWLLLGTVTCLGISSRWYIFMVYSFVTYVFWTFLMYSLLRIKK